MLGIRARTSSSCWPAFLASSASLKPSYEGIEKSSIGVDKLTVIDGFDRHK